MFFPNRGIFQKKKKIQMSWFSVQREIAKQNPPKTLKRKSDIDPGSISRPDTMSVIRKAHKLSDKVTESVNSMF